MPHHADRCGSYLTTSYGLPSFAEALKRRPDDYLALTGLGILQLKTGATAEEFEKAATALQTALMAAAQTVPQPAAGEQPQADAGPAPEEKKKSKDGKVVDGDFEVVDDGKK